MKRWSDGNLTTQEYMVKKRCGMGIFFISCHLGHAVVHGDVLSKWMAALTEQRGESTILELRKLQNEAPELQESQPVPRNPLPRLFVCSSFCAAGGGRSEP